MADININVTPEKLIERPIKYFGFVLSVVELTDLGLISIGTKKQYFTSLEQYVLNNCTRLRILIAKETDPAKKEELQEELTSWENLAIDTAYPVIAIGSIIGHQISSSEEEEARDAATGSINLQYFEKYIPQILNLFKFLFKIETLDESTMAAITSRITIVTGVTFYN